MRVATEPETKFSASAKAKGHRNADSNSAQCDGIQENPLAQALEKGGGQSGKEFRLLRPSDRAPRATTVVEITEGHRRMPIDLLRQRERTTRSARSRSSEA